MTHQYSYPVMESYYTLQGEGYHAGSAAYFIRLAGCNIGCHWCDVKESWDANNHPLVTIDTLLSDIKNTATRLVVITGGEPTIYNLDPLVCALHTVGYKVHIETSGAYHTAAPIDWICISPKKFKAPIANMITKAHELKVIICNKSDFDWAEKHAALAPTSCKLYLQPEWSVMDKINPFIIEYIHQNPQWQLSLQTHKYLNIP